MLSRNDPEAAVHDGGGAEMACTEGATIKSLQGKGSD